MPDKTTSVPTPVAGHPLTRYATVIPRRPPLSPLQKLESVPGDTWRVAVIDSMINILRNFTFCTRFSLDTSVSLLSIAAIIVDQDEGFLIENNAGTMGVVLT